MMAGFPRVELTRSNNERKINPLYSSIKERKIKLLHSGGKERIKRRRKISRKFSKYGKIERKVGKFFDAVGGIQRRKIRNVFDTLGGS